MRNMDRGVRGWLYNTARENFWRVADWYEFDDLIQDGMLHYVRVTQKYSDVKEPRHIMRLFQTVYTNHIHDLAKKRRRYELECNEASIGLSVAEVRTTRTQAPDVNMITCRLPPVLRKLVDVLQNDPRLALPSVRRGRKRETTNEMLCRLVGVDPNASNIMEDLKSHLQIESL